MNAHTPNQVAASPASRRPPATKLLGDEARPGSLPNIGAHGIQQPEVTARTERRVSPNLSTYSPCANCEGTGFFVIGDFHPDDPRNTASYDCDECDGTGEVESDTHCQCGDPLDDDLRCPSCEAQYRIESGQLVDVEVWHIENGRFGVGA